MATAHASESGSTMTAPMDVVRPSLGHLPSSTDQVFDVVDSDPRHDHVPPPNPPFSFPAQPASPSSAPSSFSRASGRRPASAIETTSGTFGTGMEGSPRHPRPSALPSFSFNPGASLPPDPHSSLLSPPITPNTPRSLASPTRPMGHGHRRGGSEFVGGRLREGNSISVMGTSPTKSESGFASPNLAPARRGHRRGVSSQISTNDLPVFHLQPDQFPSETKGSSAPTSPTNFDGADSMPMPDLDHRFAAATSSSMGFAEPPSTVMDVSKPSEDSPKPQLRTGTRARVGFSDTLEFIPRPLSLVSSDASSTMTARPSHSVSESISSNMATSSPTGRGSPAPLSRSPSREATTSRPSTAGAILEGTQVVDFSAADNMSPRRRNSIPALVDVAKDVEVQRPESSPTKTSKRWSFFGFDAFTGSGSPTKHRPASSSSSESIQRAASTGSATDPGSESLSEGTGDGVRKPERRSKKGRKKRKMKGWADSILPRKSKGHGKRSKPCAVRPPTPPAPALVQDEEEDPVEMVETPPLPPPTVTVTESTSSPLGQVSATPSEDQTYQMIDLDAALGPFNTPLPHNPEWEAAQRAAGNTGKRRLHSAQGMRGFTGPGMHYHRRAESAPDLPPFDPGRSALHRFGSSSTMDDVFEEDEEDEDEDEEQEAAEGGSESTSSHAGSSEGDVDNDASDGEATPPAGPQRDESLRNATDAAVHVVRRTGSGLSDRDQTGAQSVRTERSKTSLHDDVIMEEPSAAVFRNVNVFQESRGFSGSASASPRAFPSDKELSPVDVHSFQLSAVSGAPVSPYAASHASSYPSPRTPVSVDAQRISTAPSSIAEENSFHSLLMGEPGPEVRISVDYDIPSLTSSTSTTTRESSIPNPRTSQPMFREQRPVSVSSAFGRRRSSLVSLSRLISSSHGERSKLSMEVTLDNETDSKKQKASKKKRLGRMMQFWKPSKEGVTES